MNDELDEWNKSFPLKPSFYKSEPKFKIFSSGLVKLRARKNGISNRKLEGDSFGLLAPESLYLDTLRKTLPPRDVSALNSWHYEYDTLHGSLVSQITREYRDFPLPFYEYAKSAGWFTLDSPKKKGKKEDVLLLTLQNVSLIVGEKGFLIFRGDCVLKETGAFPGFHFAKLNKPIELGSGFFAGGRVTHNNIYHFLMDDSCRAYTYRKNCEKEIKTYFVRSKLKYVNDLANLIHDNYDFLETDVHYHFDFLHMFDSSIHNSGSPALGCNSSYFERLSYLSSKVKSVSTVFPEKIYVSRRDASARVLENDQQIQKFLEEKGFSTVVMSDYSPLEQVELFSSAKFIIAQHGAALANLAFCTPDTTVVELFCPSKGAAMYASISKAKRLNYKGVVGILGKNEKFSEPWVMPLPRLLKVLNLLV